MARTYFPRFAGDFAAFFALFFAALLCGSLLRHGLLRDPLHWSLLSRREGLLGERGGQLGQLNGAGRLAQTLDVVEGAAIAQEDVDHEIDVVHQDPLAGAAALNRVGIGAEVALEAQLNFVGDSLGLAVVGRAGDEEKIRKGRVCRIQLENSCVFALLLVAGRYGGQHHPAGFGQCHAWG